MTFSHAPGRHHDVRGHRLWVEELGVPVMVLAGRYDRALYPSMQRRFTEFGPEFLERSGSFSHVEEPDAVFALVREFSGA
jgi:proline iminopeptidase